MEYKKLLVLGIILLILWASFLWFVVGYAEDLREHPCDMCADRMGEEVTCYIGNLNKVFSGTAEVILWDKES